MSSQHALMLSALFAVACPTPLPDGFGSSDPDASAPDEPGVRDDTYRPSFDSDPPVPGGTSGGEPRCGNGRKEEPEQCDGSDLGGAVCTDFGYVSGSLGCNEQCRFDGSGCLDADGGSGGSNGGTPGGGSGGTTGGTSGGSSAPGVGSYAGVQQPGPGGTCAAGQISVCDDTCRGSAGGGAFWANDGDCMDYGPGSLFELCGFGTDCSDCGPRCTTGALCSDSCNGGYWANDGECNDGGSGANGVFGTLCDYGTDCGDCGPR